MVEAESASGVIFSLEALEEVHLVDRLNDASELPLLLLWVQLDDCFGLVVKPRQELLHRLWNRGPSPSCLVGDERSNRLVATSALSKGSNVVCDAAVLVLRPRVAKSIEEAPASATAHEYSRGMTCKCPS